MMKVTLRISSLAFGLVLWSALAWAQPANDHCDGAVDLTIYATEADAIPIQGDTRNTTDGALDNVPVCSQNFYRDDVWYKITTPNVANGSGYRIKVYYNEVAGDITGFGMAIYSSCDAVATNTALFCGNNPGDDVGIVCLGPDETVYIRVWSTTGDAVNWQDGAGTFRITAFPNTYATENQNVTVLWGDLPGEGDFDGGLNNWTTEGLQCNGTPAVNAQWTWTSTGFPFYIFGGATGIAPINSKSFCNGSVIFDSALLDLGTTNTAGSGDCPWFDHEGALISPIINLSENNSAGISVLFNQSMQRFSGGHHFVDYSLDGGATWTAIEINTEKTYLSTNPDTGEGYYNEEYRVRLPDAQNAPNLRIRFRFSGGAYWWVIDDVRIIETECTNTRVSPTWYTTAPWAIVPVGQEYAYPVMADVENVGACTQNNVALNANVSDDGSGNVFYDQNINYGSLAADSLDENRLFPALVNVPATAGQYTGSFNLSQDSTDFDPLDNSFSYHFALGGNQFALEDGATRSIAPATSNWTAGVPRSWAYGNYFNPAKDATVSSIVWGINNADSMAGHTVNVILYQWTDSNGDNVCSFGERKYIGYTEYPVTGTEPADGIVHTVLENFEDPGQPIVMKANFGYIAMIEYQAVNASDPVLELLGSDARDYRPLIFAFDSAYQVGLVDRKFYSSLLAIPMDGNLAQLDYSERFSGKDLVPVVRIEVDLGTNTTDNLPLQNQVTAYPNPASDQVSVKLDFKEAYSNVKLRLMDNLGRVVYYKALSQTFSQHVETINVRELAAGNYMLQVETTDGQRTVPVVILK